MFILKIHVHNGCHVYVYCEVYMQLCNSRPRKVYMLDWLVCAWKIISNIRAITTMPTIISILSELSSSYRAIWLTTHDSSFIPGFPASPASHWLQEMTPFSETVEQNEACCISAHYSMPFMCGTADALSEPCTTAAILEGVEESQPHLLIVMCIIAKTTCCKLKTG